MSDNLIQEQIKQDYAYGFVTDVESVRAPKGLNKEVIQFISKQKNEPEWLLAWRLKAFDRLQLMTEPNWQKPQYPKLIIRLYIITQRQRVLKKDLSH